MKKVTYRIDGNVVNPKVAQAYALKGYILKHGREADVYFFLAIWSIISQSNAARTTIKNWACVDNILDIIVDEVAY